MLKAIMERAHGSFYSYNRSRVRGIDSNLTIICPNPLHGAFKAPLYKHLMGQQCPLCEEEMSRYESGTLFFYQRTDGFFVLGVTSILCNMRTIRFKARGQWLNMDGIKAIRCDTPGFHQNALMKQFESRSFMQFPDHLIKGFSTLTTLQVDEIHKYMDSIATGRVNY